MGVSSMLCVASRVDHSIKPVKALLALLESEPRCQLGDAGLATDWISFVLTWHKISRFLLLPVVRAELGHNE
jgi:hypothetical protein